MAAMALISNFTSCVQIQMRFKFKCPVEAPAQMSHLHLLLGGNYGFVRLWKNKLMLTHKFLEIVHQKFNLVFA